MRPEHLQQILDTVLPPRSAGITLRDVENGLRKVIRDPMKAERAIGTLYGSAFKKKEKLYDGAFAKARFGKRLNPHNHIIALDPPGVPNRRWECRYCTEIGSCDDLVGPAQKNACTHVYPACPHCGQTPECAADCTAAALGSPNVRVIP